MTNQTEHHAEATIAQVRAIMDGKPFAGGTTLDLVRHWMMSEDHNPNDWERDFAAAIDAHRVEDARSNDTEHHAEQPEQWAVELAHDIDGAASMFDDEFDYEAAALTIQRAFAARDADLVARDVAECWRVKARDCSNDG